MMTFCGVSDKTEGIATTAATGAAEVATTATIRAAATVTTSVTGAANGSTISAIIRGNRLPANH